MITRSLKSQGMSFEFIYIYYFKFKKEKINVSLQCFFSYYSGDLTKQVFTNYTNRIKIKEIKGVGMYDSIRGDVRTTSNHP